MKREGKITPGELLLVSLCMPPENESARARTEELLSLVVDWEHFLKLATNHGIAALAYVGLDRAVLRDRVPEYVMAALRNARLKSMARNSALMRQMEEILKVTGVMDVKIILLKGMALELTVYGNTGLRQMSDIDLLALKKDAVRMHKALIVSGLHPVSPKSLLHRPLTGHIGKHLPTLFRNGFAIDIHHDLFGHNKSELTAKFYDTAVQTTLEDRKVYVPAPCFFFLYLVRHLHKHEEQNESQLRLYADLLMLIGKYGNEIFCPELFEYSQKAGLNELLATKLKILGEFWSISYEEHVTEFIDRWSDGEFSKRFLFFLGSPKGNPLPDRSGSYRDIFREIPGIHRKALYFIGDLFPTIRFMKKRYGCRSAWRALLYYPHRLGKIVWLFRK
jgi:hypothetical protein